MKRCRSLESHSLLPPQRSRSRSLKPSLLSLPPEIRLQIYSHLLAGVPNPFPSLTLYHDRKGRYSHQLPLPHFPRRRRPRDGQPAPPRNASTPQVDPAILRVCKAIYNEAMPVLYRSEREYMIDLSTPCVWQCTGGVYPDDLDNPVPLLRSDAALNGGEGISGQQAEPKALWEDRMDRWVLRTYGDNGVISPSNIRKLRRLTLCLSWSAVWMGVEDGEEKSHIYELVKEILQILAADGEGDGEDAEQRETSCKGSLALWWFEECEYASITPGQFLGGWGVRTELLGLLEKVARVRKVEVVNWVNGEGTLSKLRRQSEEVILKDGQEVQWPAWLT